MKNCVEIKPHFLFRKCVLLKFSLLKAHQIVSEYFHCYLISIYSELFSYVCVFFNI